MYHFYTKYLWVPPRVLGKFLLIMRLTILMLITFILQVSAVSSAQTVTLSEKKATLEHVFEKIRSQTGYDFLISKAILKKSKPVSIQVSNASLTSALDNVMAGQQLLYLIKSKTIIVIERERSYLDKLIDFFQSADIRGRVLDDKGQPMAGATVRVKDSELKTTTDQNGEFYLAEVAESAVLQISYIGYTPQEISLKGRSFPLTISMQVYNSELEEVNIAFNTGYQSIPRDRATGSFDVISEKDIAKRVATNLLERLEGSASGMLVNIGMPDRSLTKNRDNFTIRGTSTINSEKKPLIVLDGFPTELDLVNINPENIQSITILKDAAAASIWGVRAANGVIVITSKKGVFSDQPRINYSSNFTITGRPRLDYRPVLNSAEYLELEKELVDKNILPPAASPLVLYPPPLSTGADLYLQFKKGTITEQQYNSEIQRLGQIDVNDQYQEYLLQSPFAQQYNVSVTGGSSITRNYLSASYSDEYPNSKGDYGRRAGINFSNETRFTKKLSFSAETFITLLQQKNNGVGLKANQPGTNTLLPYDEIVDAKGQGVNFSYRTKTSTLDSLESETFLPWKYNYMDELANADNTTKSLAYRLNAGLNYRFVPAISADIRYMTERSYDKTRNYYNPDSYTARNLINSFTTTDTHLKGIPAGGILDLMDAEQNNYSLRGQLNLSPNFGQDHRVDGIVGVEFRETVLSGYGNRAYGYDDRLLSSTPLNYEKQYKTPDGSRTVPYIQNVSNRKDRYASVFGNFTYTYKARYSLSGSFRKDDSNLFGADKEFRSVPLWSAGGMWRLDDEDFLRNIRWIDKLNLRATVGYNGNVNKETSPYLIIQQGGSNATNGGPYANIFNPANPQLRWEKVRTFNFGTDFSLFRDRLNGSADVYWKKSTDLLGRVETNSTYGFTSLLVNQLQMKSRGVDVTLTGSLIETPEFNWILSTNLAYNVNTVTKAYFQQETTTYYTSGNPIQGQPLGSLYAYKSAGLNENGNPMIYDGRGERVLADLTTFDENDVKSLVFQGNTTPPYFGGMSNSFGYKNFELYALFTFKAGHKFMRPTAEQIYTINYTRIAHADLAERWQAPGDELKTDVPAIDPLHTGTFRYNNSDNFVENAGYIRFRDVTLTYKMPVKKLKWNVFQTLDLSFTGRNLALWAANKQGIDPDYLTDLSSSSLPPSKAFVVSVRAGF